MKLFLMAAVLTVATAAFASDDLKCVDKAVREATLKNFTSFGAGSNSCGIKKLTSGPHLETYLVCVSDESESSEWVMAMDPSSCKVRFAAAQEDAGTPNFDGEEDLLKAVSCTVYDSKKDLKCE